LTPPPAARSVRKSASIFLRFLASCARVVRFRSGHAFVANALCKVQEAHAVRFFSLTFLFGALVRDGVHRYGKCNIEIGITANEKQDEEGSGSREHRCR
jgi:hypothetical protein